MASAVKHQGDAGIRACRGVVGSRPRFRRRRVDPKERDGALSGDSGLAPPLAIVDCEPATALGFVGRRRNALTPPGTRFMVRTRATGRDGACNCDG
jgi:hypothetical protein